ncbi:hypothetical protein E2C01_076967 [Portunus trituberculatus]|uniref:Uncharacterized protein n=1 Tax=Portunus trituberculatus TaxID=210409 RepID=A0A5B7IJY0_PORTR|nr:hypothetical protein [Portunus trituberculatus]
MRVLWRVQGWVCCVGLTWCAALSGTPFSLPQFFTAWSASTSPSHWYSAASVRTLRNHEARQMNKDSDIGEDQERYLKSVK